MKYYLLVVEGVTIPKKLTLIQATTIKNWLKNTFRVSVKDLEE